MKKLFLLAIVAVLGFTAVNAQVEKAQRVEVVFDNIRANGDVSLDVNELLPSNLYYSTIGNTLLIRGFKDADHTIDKLEVTIQVSNQWGTVYKETIVELNNLSDAVYENISSGFLYVYSGPYDWWGIGNPGGLGK